MSNRAVHLIQAISKAKVRREEVYATIMTLVACLGPEIEEWAGRTYSDGTLQFGSWMLASGYTEHGLIPSFGSWVLRYDGHGIITNRGKYFEPKLAVLMDMHAGLYVLVEGMWQQFPSLSTHAEKFNVIG